MPHVKNFIAAHSDWQHRLEADYKINIVRDCDRMSLKYDQIESPMADPVVQECRGMVVRDDGIILAHPYNKFWNHGDHLAAPIDWSSARVQDKLDGSLMILYFDGDRWCTASSGSPLAGGSYGSSAESFATVMRRVFVDTGMELPTGYERTCFMFELCAPDNRIVVQYAEAKIVCHGARHLDTERELSRAELETICAAFSWPIVTEYPIGSIDECLRAADALNPIANEGFVVVDGAFNRVKIKSPRYVALHHMKGEATERRAIELYKSGEVGEVLTYFPEFAGVIEPVCARLDLFAESAMNDYVANKSAPSRKDFALAVKDRPWSALTFGLLAENEPSADAAKAKLRAMPTLSIEKMLERAS